MLLLCLFFWYRNQLKPQFKKMLIKEALALTCLKLVRTRKISVDFLHIHKNKKYESESILHCFKCS